MAGGNAEAGDWLGLEHVGHIACYTRLNGTEMVG